MAPNLPTVAVATVPVERAGFSKLIALNPNYFGNFAKSSFPSVNVIQNNTTYEEVTCIGFNPGTNVLEAVVQIKQPTGYAGDPCAAGSYEYVRFYVDYGSGLQDAGYVAVNVHDIVNAADCAKNPEKPLSFAASVTLQPHTNWCFFPVLPQVRAILSWQTIPPANDPGFNPVWGNHLDAHIQIKPRPLFFKEAGLTFNSQVLQVIPPVELEAIANQPVPLPDPGPLDLAQLTKLYAAPAPATTTATTATTLAATVPAHRYGFKDLHKALNAQVVDSQSVAASIDHWKTLGLDWQAVLATLEQVNANVTYEQIECLGLEGDPAFPRLVATLRIKRPSGYNGGLCTAGSTEYVAFWADWDDTCQFTYLGTVGVQVHDISTIPADGLVYSVVLPVDLSAHRAPCDKPKVGRVRAVLSWAVPPSTTDPNALDFWGNLIDTHVQIQPGTVPNPLYPTISILGGIPTSMIGASGYTIHNARFAGNNLLADGLGRSCPFGGVVEIQGPEFPGYKYRIQVRPKAGGAWQDVATPLLLTKWDGTTYMNVPDGSNFFTYQTYPNNIENLLGEWYSSGDDVWEVKIEIADLSDNPVPGAVADIHTIQLDNTAPVATININAGGNCGKFGVGSTLNGTFVATDANFGYYSLGTLPFPGPVTPASGSTPTAVAGNAWSLNTTGMQQCGYVVELSVSDLSIVNSSWGAHNWGSSSVGFCLLNTVS